MPFKRKSEFYIYAILFVCIVASGAYLAVSFYHSQSAIHSHDSFGVVQPVGKDVRRRGEADLSWNQVKTDADVFLEDRVFTGSTSSARVKLKKNRQFMIEPDSLIRITNESDTPLFDFDNGSFMASLVKGSKIRVKNRGHVSEIASPGGVIRLEARNESLRLIVLKGSVSVASEAGDKSIEVAQNQKVEISAPTLQVIPMSISLNSPEPGGTLDARETSEIRFQWASSKPVASFIIEVAVDPLFKKCVLKKEMGNKTQLAATLEPGQVYFWRIIGRANTDDVSITSSFAYIGHEEKPEPVIERAVASPSESEPTPAPPSLPPSESERKSPPKSEKKILFERPQEYVKSSEPQKDEPKIEKPKILETPAALVLPSSHRWTLPVFSVFSGLGASYVKFEQQSSQPLENGKFAKITSPTISAGGSARLTKKSQVAIKYNNIPGEFSTTTSTAIDRSKFNWTTLSTEYEHVIFEQSQNRIWLLAGLQIHDLPFLSENSSGTTNLIENDLKNLSVGAKVEHRLESNYNYEGLLRYQYPVSISSGIDFTLRPRAVFDGLLGVSRQFDSGMKIGLYWYGQYWNFNYTSSRDGLSSSGSQSMFNSSFQIRLELGFFDDSK